MTTTTTQPQRSSLLNIVSQPQVQSLLEDARQRISEEEGVSFRSVNGHFKKPFERDFVAEAAAVDQEGCRGGADFGGPWQKQAFRSPLRASF